MAGEGLDFLGATDASVSTDVCVVSRRKPATHARTHAPTTTRRKGGALAAALTILDLTIS